MHDIEQHKGMSNELVDYRERTGEEAIWTNAMFGGMPGYLISVIYKGNLLASVGTVMKMGLPRPADYMFVMMLGIYVLLLSLKVRQPLAIIGAAAYAFSTYNLLSMEAGHMSKIDAMSWMPWVLAGVVIAFRGRWLAGGIFTAIALSLQVKASHFQITYYLAFIVLLFALFYMIEAIRTKTISGFIKPAAALLLAMVFGVLTNISALYTIYDYGKDSIRGKSELTITGKEDTGGLDPDYAFAYSYGVGESFSYMIPNVYGGASNIGLGEQKGALKNADDQYQQIMQQLPQYWSDTDTTGPFYAGALICFLCVVGFFFVKGPVKWAILASIIVGLLLSWGKNNMDFSVFLLNNLPGFNKFRSVKMALVITDFLIPLMAVLGLNEIINNPFVIKEKSKLFIASFILTGGLCLLFYVLPDMFFSFDFIQPQIVEQLTGMLKQNKFDDGGVTQWLQGLRDNLEIVRIDIFKAEALRAFFLITMGAAALFAYGRFKFSPIIITVIILVITVGDLFSVDKRYVNKKDFISRNKIAIPYEPGIPDEAVYSMELQADPSLKGKIDAYIAEAKKNSGSKSNGAAEEAKTRFRGLLANTDYRVLNLTTSTFNDAATSFYHKSVGGYSAAKLERYQEFIEYHLQKNIQELGRLFNSRPTDSTMKAGMQRLYALNMLNTKYIIYSQEGPPINNSAALGNAWFVNEIKMVKNANEEIQAMDASFNPKQTAIVDQRFSQQVSGVKPGGDASASIMLTSYAPNLLTYDYQSSFGQVAVFSEIYYAKGWHAYIDGSPAPHFRTNYILRGMIVPAGKHKIEFKFEPAVYYTTEKVSMASSVVLIIVALGSIVMWYRKRNQSEIKKAV